MCSKKCANPVRPCSYSSREPVRTTVQYAASPSLGMGTTMAVRPFGSVRVSVGYGMIGVTGEVSWLDEGSGHVAASAPQSASSRGQSRVLRKVIVGFYAAASSNARLARDAGLAVFDVERREHVSRGVGARDVVDRDEIRMQSLGRDGDARV